MELFFHRAPRVTNMLLTTSTPQPNIWILNRSREFIYREGWTSTICLGFLQTKVKEVLLTNQPKRLVKKLTWKRHPLILNTTQSKPTGITSLWKLVMTLGERFKVYDSFLRMNIINLLCFPWWSWHKMELPQSNGYEGDPYFMIRFVDEDSFYNTHLFPYSILFRFKSWTTKNLLQCTNTKCSWLLSWRWWRCDAILYQSTSIWI